MVDNGFAKKVVMEGAGAKAGESYAWAIANPDKVSVIYARNPLMRSLMANTPPTGSPAPLDPYLPSPSKTQPIDNLAPLAKAGVPILHDCGSLDPWLKDNTRVVEKRYKELGGNNGASDRGRGSLPGVAQGSEAGCGFYSKQPAVGTPRTQTDSLGNLKGEPDENHLSGAGVHGELSLS